MMRAESSAGTPEAEIRQDAAPVFPWTIRAGSLQLDDSAFEMGDGQAKTMELVLSGIGIRLDSVYNRGSVVKAQLKDLQVVQQGGVEVTAMRGDVGLDSTRTWLQGGYLRTLNSWLELDVFSPANLSHLVEREPLSVRVTGQVGMADVVPFYSGIPKEIRNAALNVNTAFSLTGSRLQVGQLVLDMANRFKLTGSGSLSFFRELNKMKGTFVMR